MQYQASWSAPSLPDIDGTQPQAARLDRMYGAVRRLVAEITDFYRELDYGWEVMRGQRQPDQPSPSELDTLVRTRVVRLPHDSQ